MVCLFLCFVKKKNISFNVKAVKLLKELFKNRHIIFLLSVNYVEWYTSNTTLNCCR